MSERIKARFAAIALAGLAAALVLVFQAFPSGALAQEKGDLRQDAASNSYAPELPNLGVVTVTVAAIDGFCKSIKYQATLSRPFGSFNAAFDELSASEIGKELALIEKNLLELDDPAECANLTDQKDPVEVERTFKAHSPNPNVISVLYTYFFSSPWAAHPFTKFETVNFDLAESRELTLNDVIPSSSLEALWAEVAKGWCSYNDNHSLPYFYNFPEDDLCKSPEKIPLPPALAADKGSLEALGNAYLTADGLVLQLAAEDGWSYAEGASELVLKKEDLIKLGANPAVWGASK